MSILIASSGAVLSAPGPSPWMNFGYFHSFWFHVPTSGIAFRDIFAISADGANNNDVDAISIPSGATLELDIKRGGAYPSGGIVGTSVVVVNTDYWVALQRWNPWRVDLWLGTLTSPPRREATMEEASGVGMMARVQTANALIIYGAWASGTMSGTAMRIENGLTIAGPDFRPLTDEEIFAQWLQRCPVRPAWSHHPMMELDGRDESGFNRPIASLGTATLAANVLRPWGSRLYRKRLRRAVKVPAAITGWVPDTTVAAGGWTDQSGGTSDLHSPLNDESPSTYIQSPASPTSASVAKVGLTDVTPGAGETVIIEVDSEQGP